MIPKKIKKYIANTSWLLSEKGITVIVGFLVSIVVARFLGPENYGVLGYVISLTTLFSVAGHMGLSGLVIREIVRDPNGRGEVLGTTYLIKLAGMAIGVILILLYASIIETPGTQVFYMLLIAASAMLIQPVNVIDFWFQSQVQAKYSAIARTVGLLVSSFYKLLLVFSGLGLVYFALSGVVQAVVSAMVLLILYRHKATVTVSQWRFNFARAITLLKQSWMVFAGAIFAVIYMKIDMVMLKLIAGAESAGVYSVAAQLSEAWYFVPTAIVASLFPKLIKLREQDEGIFYKRLQQLFDLLFMMAVAVAVVVTLLAPFVVDTLYGQAYSESSNVLAIHIWAGVFIFMRAAFSKWILIENALVFSLITQGCGALMNVFLNYLLIPYYGATGAAIATLVSYGAASYFALLFNKRTRPIFWMMTKSFLFPARYIYSLRT
ncbi:flippase [Aliidiomarina soli]|uniref:flippase n=1 Tax=Aliidiomarina soli TaxID=1928574 RepID=UPI0018E53032|nr:flippase [Aliidiomarina soli]